ncbi:hypothetical protein EHO98_19320 [Leptospira stimsonii]|uniref:Uncharacterized protein n=2 Tax=Leptospira stimsonii TaxID=2202203 RepID=A0ABY2N5E5_9LEPT|nr:hypothetical protein EHO98_19320 [Leptospira stimsonii]TGM16938.1 hypothetical protein EHQ90_08455 [Leptospira stimsonii]
MGYLNLILLGSIILNILLLYFSFKFYLKLREIQKKANLESEQSESEFNIDIKYVDNSFTLFGDGKEYYASISSSMTIDEIFARGRKRDAAHRILVAETYERNKLANKIKNDRARRRK